MDLIGILLILSAFIGVLTAVWIATANKKDGFGYLALVLIACSFWAVTILLAIQTGSTTIANFSFAGGTFMLTGSLLFIMVFTGKIFRYARSIFLGAGIIMSGLTLMPGSIGREIDTSGGYIQMITPGPMFVPFYIYFAILVVALFYFTITGWKLIKGHKKAQLEYIIFGVSVAFALSIFFNLVLPAFGDYRFNNLGPITMIVLSACALVVAARHYIYGKRVVFSEFYAVFIILIATVRTVVSPSYFNYLLTAAVIVICFLFIRSLMSEASKNKQLEKDKSDLKKLDRMKDEFLMIATHELNTPITLLEGKTSMILDESFGDFSKEQKEYLRPILDNAKRLAELFKEIVQVVKVDEHAFQICKSQVLMDQVVDKSLEKLENEQENYTLNYTHPNNPITIKADGEKLSQVIEHLLDNAIKFSTLSGRRGIITVTLTEKEKEVLFSVKDNGVGINKADQKHIAERFFQAGRFDEKDPLEQHGPGLGLYISRRIIELHHGKIWFESKPGHGTEFFFSLPK